MATPALDWHTFANQDTGTSEDGRYQCASFAKVSALSGDFCMRSHCSKQSTFVRVHERGPLMRCENVKATADQSSRECSNACSRCLSNCWCGWLLWNCLVSVIRSVSVRCTVKMASWCVFAAFEASWMRASTKAKICTGMFTKAENRFLGTILPEIDHFGKFSAVKVNLRQIWRRFVSLRQIWRRFPIGVKNADRLNFNTIKYR